MELAKVNSDLEIEFPSSIKKWLSAESELAVFLQGDIMVLKKIQIPAISTVAKRKAGEEMALSEIVEEVHRYRDEKRRE